MPETIDFDATATALIALIDGVHDGIVERLRQVWNARGAADIATIESQLSQMMGASASGPYIRNLDRALRALDR